MFPIGTGTTCPQGGFGGTAWLLADLPRFPSNTFDLSIGFINSKTCSGLFAWTLTKFFTFPEFAFVLNYKIVSPLCTLVLVALHNLMSFVKSFKWYQWIEPSNDVSVCSLFLQQCKYHPPHIHLSSVASSPSSLKRCTFHLYHSARTDGQTLMDTDCKRNFSCNGLGPMEESTHLQNKSTMRPKMVRGPGVDQLNGGEGGHLMLNISLHTTPSAFVCNGVCCQAKDKIRSGRRIYTEKTSSEKWWNCSCGKKPETWMSIIQRKVFHFGCLIVGNLSIRSW